MAIFRVFRHVKIFIWSVLKLLYWYLEGFYRLFIPPPLKSIDGETILVTGAAGGIGSEICHNLLKSAKNIKLILWDINKPALENLEKKLQNDIKEKGHQIFSFEVDISKKENIKNCCQKVGDLIGPISIIFNNAATVPMGNLLLQTDEEIKKVVQVNLMSHLWILRELLPDMIKQNHGRIVNVCSITSHLPTPVIAPYSATKCAINGYTEAMQIELDISNCDGIHLTTVYPTFVKTQVMKSLDWDNKSESIFNSLPNPVRQFLEPEMVGRKIVDGMRREYNHIYLPATIPLMAVILNFLIPTKARRSILKAFFTQVFVFRDEAENAHVHTTFSDVVKDASGNNKDAKFDI